MITVASTVIEKTCAEHVEITWVDGEAWFRKAPRLETAVIASHNLLDRTAA
jgi:hypothetical protein